MDQDPNRHDQSREMTQKNLCYARPKSNVSTFVCPPTQLSSELVIGVLFDVHPHINELTYR